MTSPIVIITAIESGFGSPVDWHSSIPCALTWTKGIPLRVCCFLADLFCLGFRYLYAYAQEQSPGRAAYHWSDSHLPLHFHSGVDLSFRQSIY